MNTTHSEQENRQFSVRGHGLPERIAPRLDRLASLAADFSLTAALYLLVLPRTEIPFSPMSLHLGGVFALTLATRELGRSVWGASLGDHLWSLSRLPGRPGLKKKLFAAKRSHTARLGASLITCALACAPAASFLVVGEQNLILQEGLAESIAATTTASNSPNTGILSQEIPLFYLVGSWPTEVRGQPVFYSLPYSKGPPQRFIPSVSATWDLAGDPSGDTYVKFEGPRTPEGTPSADEIRSCILPGWKGKNLASCLNLRERLLRPQQKALSALHPEKLKLSWFEIEGGADAPRGIHLRSENLETIEDRYLVVTSTGAIQNVHFRRPNSTLAVDLESQFLQSFASQRVETDLQKSRLWTDQLLASVSLSHLEQLSEERDWARAFTEIEALLVAKLSVEPTTVEPFFHLGGLASILANEAKRRQKPLWAQFSSAIFENTLRFAEDVSPRDSRITSLRRTWK